MNVWPVSSMPRAARCRAWWRGDAGRRRTAARTAVDSEWSRCGGACGCKYTAAMKAKSVDGLCGVGGRLAYRRVDMWRRVGRRRRRSMCCECGGCGCAFKALRFAMARSHDVGLSGIITQSGQL